MIKNRKSKIIKIVLLSAFAGAAFLVKNSYIYWIAVTLAAVAFLKKGDRFLFFISLIFLIPLFYFGFLRFSILPQVLAIIDAPIIALIVGIHPWLPRYFITFPAILIHKLSGQDIDTAYTMMCMLLMAGTSVIMRSILLSARQKKTFLRPLIGLTILAVISTRMNGRLIPAYFGIALIIYVFSNIISKKSNSTERFVLNLKMIISITIGSWLTMVSSGTMMVSFVLILTMLIYITVSKNPPVYTPSVMVTLTLIGCLVFGYAIFMTNRNIVFFSDDLYGLFMHGLVRFIDLSFYIRIAVVLITPAAILFACVAVYFVCRRCPPLLPALLSVPISVFCGLFGISTATMMIPALIVLFLAALPNITFYHNKEALICFIESEK